jgi:hypothetical protein
MGGHWGNLECNLGRKNRADAHDIQTLKHCQDIFQPGSNEVAGSVGYSFPTRFIGINFKFNRMPTVVF